MVRISPTEGFVFDWQQGIRPPSIFDDENDTSPSPDSPLNSQTTDARADTTDRPDGPSRSGGFALLIC